jgi:hypothetical protein
MGRRIFVDGDAQQFIQSQASRVPLDRLRFRYDTFEELDFVFVRGGVPYAPPDGTALQFVVKELGKYDGIVVAGIPFEGFSRITEGGLTFYRGYIDTTTQTIQTALGVDASDGNDVAELVGHCELLMITDGRKSRTQIIPAVISNSLSRDGDTVPTVIPSGGIYLTPGDIGDTVAGLVGGKVPLENLPDLTITAVRVVADSAARLALTGIGVGTAAIQLDQPANLYILVELPAATSGNWQVVGNGAILRSQITDFAHAATHKNGGADSIKLDELATPTDNTNLNATATRHGLLPKLAGANNVFLNGLGQWVEIAALGGGFPLWTNVQSRPAAIDQIAGLSPANNDFLQRLAGVWTNRTPAQVKAALALATADINGLQTTLNGLQTAIDSKAALAPATNEQTGTAYTLAATDAGLCVRITNAAAITLTVPPDSTVIPVGTTIELCQGGAGKITVAPGAGVTIECPATNRRTTAQFAGATLKKRAANTWWLEGRLE